MTPLEKATAHQVSSDGKTVWAHAPDGSCVGRFSRFGIDLHRTVSAQMAGEPECLDCTHALPELAEWRRFQEGLRVHHGIGVGDAHMPKFIAGGPDSPRRESCGKG